VAITKAKKEAVLDKLNDVRAKAASIVFVHFKGLTVGHTSVMRKAFRERGVGYLVAKKTLLKRAFDKHFRGEAPSLSGEIAVAWSDDAITPAQSVKEFADRHKGSLTIVGGVFEGVFKNKEEMTEIASIPPLETLRGMFVNLINSPIQGFAVALDAIAKKKQG
jgi:large subunit ribosomal protein L10